MELLADSATGSDELRREAIEILRTAIGFDRWCTLLLDPETLVICQGLGDIDWHVELPRLNLFEASLCDVNSHAVLARSRDHVGVLSAATGGDLTRSRRWREILGPYSVGDELACVAADQLGCWGDFRLYRSADDAPFSAEDAQLVRQVSASLALALRRGAVVPVSDAAEFAPAEMGVMLLDRDLHPCGATDAARS